MPLFEAVTELASPPPEVFDFLCRPANLIQVSPPELNMTLLDGPERLQLGSRVTLQGQRMGVRQKIVSEITACEPTHLLVDVQREGPFGRWVHTHRFEVSAAGTRMTDSILFEAPGGLLGFVLTNRRIEEELKWVFAYRAKRFKELLG